MVNSGKSRTVTDRSAGAMTKQDQSTPSVEAFALDLSRQGLALFGWDPGSGWVLLAREPLKLGTVAKAMDNLRAAAGVAPGAVLTLDVWLPQDQILVRKLKSGGAATLDAKRRLYSDVDGGPEALHFDETPNGQSTPGAVAAVPLSTLSETRSFLEPHDLAVRDFTLRVIPEGLSHPPIFSAPRMTKPIAWKTPAAAAAAIVAATAGVIWLGVQLMAPAENPLANLETAGVDQAVNSGARAAAFDLMPGPLHDIGRPQRPSELGVTSASTAPEPVGPPAGTARQPAARIAATTLPDQALSDAPTVPGSAPQRVSSAPAQALVLRDSIPNKPDRFTAPVQTRVETLAQAEPDRLAPIAAPPEPGNLAGRPASLTITAASTAPERFRLPTEPDNRARAQVHMALPTSVSAMAEPVVPSFDTAVPTAALPSISAIENTRPEPPAIFTAPLQTEVARIAGPADQLAAPEQPAGPVEAQTDRGLAPESLARVEAEVPATPEPLARQALSPTRPDTAASAPTLPHQETPTDISLARAPIASDDLTGIGSAGPASLLSPLGAPTPMRLRTRSPAEEASGPLVSDAPLTFLPPAGVPAPLAPASGQRFASIAPPSRGDAPAADPGDIIKIFETRPRVVPPSRPEAVVQAALSLEIGALVAEADSVDLSPSDAAISQSDPPPRRPEAMERAEIEQLERLAALAPTERALDASSGPRRRPEGLVAALPPAVSEPQAAAQPPTATVAPPPAETRAAPQLPTTASVARAATVQNALPLRRLVLIGVYGASNNRHALLRTPAGQYLKVGPGDSIEGYEVAAISGDAIRLRRRGRDTLLVIPE